MTLPSISQTVAYDALPYNVLDFPIIDGHLHIELSQCPGTLSDPNTGWHEAWEPFDSIFVLMHDFVRSVLSRVQLN